MAKPPPAKPLKSAADALQVDARTKALNDAAAQVIALAAGRESATRSDYAHPRFKDIVKVLADLSGPD